MKKSLISFIISVICLPVEAYASKDWIFSPTLLYSNKRIEKGALIWDAPFLITAIAVNYKNRILLGNGGISFRLLDSEKHKFSLAYTNFNDDKTRFPLLHYLEDFDEDYKNSRTTTSAIRSVYQYIPSQGTRLNFEWEKDISVHYKNYYQIGLSQRIIPLTSLTLQYGYGDKEHNQYMYGDTAQNGETHLEYGVGLFLPFLPFKGMMRIAYSQSQILQKSSVKGEYIQGNAKEEQLMILAFWVL